MLKHYTNFEVETILKSIKRFKLRYKCRGGQISKIIYNTAYVIYYSWGIVSLGPFSMRRALSLAV